MWLKWRTVLAVLTGPSAPCCCSRRQSLQVQQATCTLLVCMPSSAVRFVLSRTRSINLRQMEASSCTCWRDIIGTVSTTWCCTLLNSCSCLTAFVFRRLWISRTLWFLLALFYNKPLGTSNAIRRVETECKAPGSGLWCCCRWQFVRWTEE
jgi:hypothetical protein